MTQTVEKASERISVNIGRKRHEKLRVLSFKQKRSIKAILDELIDKHL